MMESVLSKCSTAERDLFFFFFFSFFNQMSAEGQLSADRDLPCLSNSQQAKAEKHRGGKQVLICFGFLSSRHASKQHLHSSKFIYPRSHSSVVVSWPSSRGTKSRTRSAAPPRGRAFMWRHRKSLSLPSVGKVQ